MARGAGPGKVVAAADLLLNKVFANPLLRQTEIVTDPIFQAYLERNRVKHHLPPAEAKKAELLR